MKHIELNNQVMIKDENGKLQLHKDIEALNVYLEEVINPKMLKFDSLKERLNYLVENNYYSKDVLDKYSEDFIIHLDKVNRSYGFKFKSYMSANKFYQNYSLKTDDGKYILEDYNDKVLIVALTLADGNEELALNLAGRMILQEFQPATPTFLNAGRARAGEKVSCFLLSVEDSTEGITYALSSASHLSKIGGGVALNLTRLRASGEAIKGIQGASGGVVGVAKMLEQSFMYFNQMGARQGAGAVFLNVFHPDFELLLDSKKINADEKIRLASLSVGALIPNKFMELAEKNETGYVFYPYTVFKKYGVHLDEINMNEWYDKLVNDSDIRKKEMNPRQLLTRIAQIQQESGYPYVVYIDTANEEHTLKDLGVVKMSNLCVTGETRLHTNLGMIKAKDLYDKQSEFKVSIDNRTKELNVDSLGVDLVEAIPMQLTAKSASVYKIKTKQGYEIRATEWHKFYRKVGDKIEKVSLNELKENDKLLIQSDEGVYGQFDDVELAFVTGVINGDGTITDNNVKIYLYGEKSYLKDKLEDMIANIIDRYKIKEYKKGVFTNPKFKYYKKNNKWVLTSRRLFDILNHFGVNKENKTRVPDFVFSGNKEVNGAFLSGLYQMDGCVNSSPKHKVMTYELSSIDEQGIKDIQLLLANSGVFTTIYKCNRESSLLPNGKGGFSKYNTKDIYKISIQDRLSRDRFSSFVKLKEKDENKIKEFNKILQPTSRKPKHNFTAEIISIEFDGLEDVYDTTQPDYHSLIFNGIVTGNCTEIFQYQTPSDIKGYGATNTWGQDISCNLGSLNIVNVMENKDIETTIETAIRGLSFVSDNTNIKEVPTVKNGNNNSHAIGLGAMNLHGYFMKNNIIYTSKEALEFVDVFFAMMRYYSIKASMKIAKEKNKTFEGFEKSEYAKGAKSKLFKKYIEKDYLPTSDKVKQLFEGIKIPTKTDWVELLSLVQHYGIYNAYLNAIAPTQSISYVQNSTSSIMPITEQIEVRTYGDSTTIYPMPFLTNENLLWYQSAYRIDMKNVIDIVATIQQHIDQGISTTLFVTDDKTTRDIAKYYIYAYKKGLKSLYYTRTKMERNEECLSCSV